MNEPTSAEQSGDRKSRAILLLQMKEALQAATPQERDTFGKMLGFSPIRKEKSRPGLTNSTVRQIVLQHGPIIREPGFEPNVPDAVALKGERATKIWLEAWHEGTILPVEKLEMQLDMDQAEQLALNESSLGEASVELGAQ